MNIVSVNRVVARVGSKQGGSMPELQESIAVRYLRETMIQGNRCLGKRPAIGEASPYKHFPQVPAISLPTDWQLEETRLDRLLQNRRSCRSYAKAPMGLGGLAFLLWSSQGITGRAGSYLFRTAPSGGALYPLETYIVCHRVTELEPGLYHFNVLDFSLERLRSGALARELTHACLGQRFVAGGAVTIVWSALLRRTMSKYGHRGLRYILMEAGHVCQNLLLAAGAIGCRGCPVAAFDDPELARMLGLDIDEEVPLYLTPVGLPEKQK